jgi:hypothetical protein
MITIPSMPDLLVAATSLAFLMICQWLISGTLRRNRRRHTSQPGRGPSARTEFHQAA